MPLTATINSISASGQNVVVDFTLVPSGSYTSGGDAISLPGAAAATNFEGQVASIPTTQAPLTLAVWNEDADIKYLPIVDLANLKCLFISAFNTELGAGAYPAEITKLGGRATYNKFL